MSYDDNPLSLRERLTMYILYSLGTLAGYLAAYRQSVILKEELTILDAFGLFGTILGLLLLVTFIIHYTKKRSKP